MEESPSTLGQIRTYHSRKGQTWECVAKRFLLWYFQYVAFKKWHLQAWKARFGTYQSNSICSTHELSGLSFSAECIAHLSQFMFVLCWLKLEELKKYKNQCNDWTHNAKAQKHNTTSQKGKDPKKNKTEVKSTTRKPTQYDAELSQHNITPYRCHRGWQIHSNSCLMC